MQAALVVNVFCWCFFWCFWAKVVVFEAAGAVPILSLENILWILLGEFCMSACAAFLVRARTLQARDEEITEVLGLETTFAAHQQVET